MKEEFDLSRYLNIEMAPELKQSLLDSHSKRAISAKLEKKQAEQSEQSESSLHSSASEQTLPSQPLNEAKEAEKAEHSEQEKRQAVSSIPRRISHKQRQESLESYREAFLTPHKIIDRKAAYLSRSTWERLEFVVRRLGDYGANVSSFLECIALRHLEEHSEDIEHWRKL
ncbi:DUF3408 domain-containing protein [Bacteroides pyogenes]|uniref:DUF3408 domain-containing protein n=1 Tax=Bacteroides pyogenes TaxID=310300 RepID=UPI001DB3AE02|nr:DUF3408 domain-containing protein [Bacteroides pyogenes]MBR8707360.1 hypothetical protein [Bacteroides pyogenes]MBR8716169.1 hypothetical protein [Bacteroides pyogenes]MBR8745696.1 hypothetical protein [Bacteroides pyogenes]MBR8756005.1 hypothetical protein [Bacteroides pyogenes]MBR8779229.1 hypothetical protein [Bacteroides pyogenes]